jgi:hypothetical protein
MEEPLAELERTLIDEYIRRAGHDPVEVRARGDEAARKLLIDASVHAAARLTEVESRAHYVRDLHHSELRVSRVFGSMIRTRPPGRVLRPALPA